MILLGALAILGIFVVFFFIPNMSNIYLAMGKDTPLVYSNIIMFKQRLFNNPIIVIVQITIITVILPYFIIKNFLKQYLDMVIEKIPIYNLINEYIVIVLMSVVIIVELILL